ncbi:porin family protein [Chitinimonas sp. JJ19]|uniref:porin family protein n=1 Tax=Chitinimonas sp. JJ19 TaxID=3109352 RepID=UPI00300147DB
MKTMTKQTIALSALIAGLSAVPAMADANGVYVFGQATHARETHANKQVANGIGAGVGYRLSDNFAVEGGYTGLKERTGMADQTANVRAVGILPVNEQIEVNGKLGYARTGDTLGNAAKDGLTYGVGASYKLDKNWAVRADYDRLKAGGEQRINAYSAGVQYQF